MEILTPLQIELLKIFGTLEEADYFYLSGGTALSAFYLQHRFSEDLDFFTNEEELVVFMGDRLTRSLENNQFIIDTRRKFKSFYEMITTKGNESVKIHLAFEAPFRFEVPQRKEYGVKIDTLIDIATNKLLTLWGRFEPRDFVDVYFLVKEKYPLEDLIKMAKEKDAGLEEYSLALSFHKAKDLPEDLSAFPVNLVRPLNLREMKEFFIKEAVTLLGKAKEPEL